MPNRQNTDLVAGQGIAAYVDYLNHLRMEDLLSRLDVILADEMTGLNELVQRQAEALAKLDLAKVDIEKIIQQQRGGDKGVHGFIAEFAEEGIRNARNALEGLKDTVSILNNNGPVDLILNDKPVQMKFYANLLKEIQAAQDYNMDMVYPKNHIETIQKIMNGEKIVLFNGNRLSNRQITKIKEVIEEESKRRGLSWDKWMKSSVLEYKQVQKGAINQTLAQEEASIKQKALVKQHSIKETAKREQEQAYQQSKANFGEATKAAKVGALLQGGMNFEMFLYKKHQEGKAIWELTGEDWREAGVETITGMAKGGISGYAIYGLTNVCHFSAPSASAIVSGTFDLANAILHYRSGKIDAEGFMNLVTLNVIDVAGVAVGATIGQTLIPIPTLGAVVGSIVASTAISLGKDMLSKHERELIESYQKEVDKFVSKLDIDYQQKVNQILENYHHMGAVQKYSFDFDLNIQLQFVSSIELANLVGVEDEDILHNEEEIDAFFLS